MASLVAPSRQDFEELTAFEINDEWLNYVFKQLVDADPSFTTLPRDVITKLILQQVLNCDLSECAKLQKLPTNIQRLKELQGRFFLQLQEVIDVAMPTIERYKEGFDRSQHLFKLHLTDGFASVMALTDRPLLDLRWDTPAGAKVYMQGPVEVADGVLMLNPECCKVLGGRVVRLEEARKRVVAFMNRPVVGRRGPPLTLAELRRQATAAAWGDNTPERDTEQQRIQQRERQPSQPILQSNGHGNGVAQQQQGPSVPQLQQQQQQQLQQQGFITQGGNGTLPGSASFGTQWRQGNNGPAQQVQQQQQQFNFPPHPPQLMNGGNLAPPQQQQQQQQQQQAPAPVARLSILEEEEEEKEEWEEYEAHAEIPVDPEAIDVDLLHRVQARQQGQQRVQVQEEEEEEINLISDDDNNVQGYNDEDGEDQDDGPYSDYGFVDAAAAGGDEYYGYEGGEEGGDGGWDEDGDGAYEEDGPADNDGAGAGVDGLDVNEYGLGDCIDGAAGASEHHAPMACDTGAVQDRDTDNMLASLQDPVEDYQQPVGGGRKGSGAKALHRKVVSSSDEEEDEGLVKKAQDEQHTPTRTVAGRHALPGSEGTKVSSGKRNQTKGSDSPSKMQRTLGALDTAGPAGGRDGDKAEGAVGDKSKRRSLNNAFDSAGSSRLQGKSRLEVNMELLQSEPGSTGKKQAGTSHRRMSLPGSGIDKDALEALLRPPPGLDAIRKGAATGPPAAIPPPQAPTNRALFLRPSPTQPGSQGTEPYTYLSCIQASMNDAGGTTFPIKACVNGMVKGLYDKNHLQYVNPHTGAPELWMVVEIEDGTAIATARLSHTFLLDHFKMQLPELKAMDARKDPQFIHGAKELLQLLLTHYGLISVKVEGPGEMMEIVDFGGALSSSQLQQLRDRIGGN